MTSHIGLRNGCIYMHTGFEYAGTSIFWFSSFQINLTDLYTVIFIAGTYSSVWHSLCLSVVQKAGMMELPEDGWKLCAAYCNLHSSWLRWHLCNTNRAYIQIDGWTEIFELLYIVSYCKFYLHVVYSPVQGKNLLKELVTAKKKGGGGRKNCSGTEIANIPAMQQIFC